MSTEAIPVSEHPAQPFVLAVPDIARFMRKVPVGEPDECWEYEGGQLRPGSYGQFWISSVGRCVGAHQVMALIAFGAPTLTAPWVLHACDNPPCVNPAHLHYGTPLENMRDCNERGRRVRGERQHLARLTAEDVQAIRESSLNRKVLATHYGVHFSTIYRVLQGATWGHV